MNKFMADREDEGKPAPAICSGCDEEMERQLDILEQDGVDRTDCDYFKVLVESDPAAGKGKKG